MSELMLQLPETLHQQLETLAESEGVSLNNYVVYTLTRQVALAYTIQVTSAEEIVQQRANFDAILARLGKPSDERLDELLANRPVAEPDPELSLETIEKLKKLIANQQATTGRH